MHQGVSGLANGNHYTSKLFELCKACHHFFLPCTVEQYGYQVVLYIFFDFQNASFSKLCVLYPIAFLIGGLRLSEGRKAFLEKTGLL